jgi:hypothetical protein
MIKLFSDYSWDEKMEILEKAGWTIQCESPFEIVSKDGSFASKEAAYICVDPIVENYLIEQQEIADEEEIRLALAMYRDLDAHIK